MARNLSPWEVYAVDDRGSFDFGRTTTVSEEGDRTGKNAIGVSILDLDDEIAGKRKDEETRVRWFIKEYDNRPILSRVFERRVPIKDAEVRHLQLSMIAQNAIIAWSLTIVIEIIFVALPRGHFF
ncbi:hypothetical protein TWF281_006659 [Arthrobotrys megalospora]